MKKRILCLLMAAALLLGVLAGCGGGAASSDAVTATPQPQPTTGPEDEPANTDGEAEPSDAQQESDVDTPPVEEPDDGLGEGVYVVTQNDIRDLVLNFVVYACECIINGEPYFTISDLISNGQSMPVSGDLSLVKVDSRMALDSNYEDKYFYLLMSDLGQHLRPWKNHAIKDGMVYVDIKRANFHDFHYYQNTDAVLVSEVCITVNYTDADNKSQSEKFLKEFKFVNETDNPEQWLILARKGEGSISDIQVNEDGASNNLSWSELYRTFLCSREDLDRSDFAFFDADSDGVPEALYKGQMFRINQNNVPEKCNMETDEFDSFIPLSFDEAVRRYEIYAEGMNNGAAEIIRAYQEILPEDFDWPVDENGEEYVPDDYKYHSTDLFIDDFGSDQIMMLFDNVLYQYKDGKAIKAFDFSELEGLDDAVITFISMNDDKTEFYVSAYSYDAETDVYTDKDIAIDARNYTIIKTLSRNWFGAPSSYGIWSWDSEDFINAFEVTASGIEELTEDEASMRADEYWCEAQYDCGWGSNYPFGYYSARNAEDAYRAYTSRCTQ